MASGIERLVVLVPLMEAKQEVCSHVLEILRSPPTGQP